MSIKLLQATERNKSTVENIMHAFYNSTSNAYAFQYVDLDTKYQYPPEAEFYVQQYLDVETTHQIPLSLLEIASTSNTVDELIVNLRFFSTEDVKALEEHTRGQNENPDWKSQHVSRITASIIHRVMTKLNSINKNVDNASADALVKLLMGQTSQVSRGACLKHEMAK